MADPSDFLLLPQENANRVTYITKQRAASRKRHAPPQICVPNTVQVS